MIVTYCLSDSGVCEVTQHAPPPSLVGVGWVAGRRSHAGDFVEEEEEEAVVVVLLLLWWWGGRLRPLAVLVMAKQEENVMAEIMGGGWSPATFCGDDGGESEEEGAMQSKEVCFCVRRKRRKISTAISNEVAEYMDCRCYCPIEL